MDTYRLRAPAFCVVCVPGAQGGLPPGRHARTYWLSVPASAVPYVPRTVAPQALRFPGYHPRPRLPHGQGALHAAGRGHRRARRRRGVWPAQRRRERPHTQPINWLHGDVLLDNDDLSLLSDSVTMADVPDDPLIAKRRSLFEWIDGAKGDLGREYISSFARYYKK